NELREYNPELLDKPRLLALSKRDLIDDELEQMLSQTLPPDVPALFISSATGHRIQELKDLLWRTLN
ncbi:MAG: GTPase ObgE, partial [Saprospiraceae bacterium]